MRDRRREAGITLIELMIAVTLLGIIIVPLTTAMVTGLISTGEAASRLSESRSPLFASAYFADDAQSSDVNGITVGGTASCGGGTNVVTFTWNETNAGTNTQYVASYATSNGKLIRSFCKNSVPVTTTTVAPVLGANLSCGRPACATVANDASGLPRTITLNVTTNPDTNKFFTLVATRRAT